MYFLWDNKWNFFLIWMFGIFIEVMMMIVIAVVKANRWQITSALSSCHHRLRANFGSIVGLTHQRHEIDETFGDVPLFEAKLTGRIVLRECVMVVVKAFADREKRHKPVLDRVDAFIVRFVTPQVSSTVYQPGKVQLQRVAQHCRYIIGVFERFAPKVHRNYRWKDGNHEKRKQ